VAGCLERLPSGRDTSFALWVQTSLGRRFLISVAAKIEIKIRRESGAVEYVRITCRQFLELERIAAGIQPALDSVTQRIVDVLIDRGLIDMARGYWRPTADGLVVVARRQASQAQLAERVRRQERPVASPLRWRSVEDGWELWFSTVRRLGALKRGGAVWRARCDLTNMRKRGNLSEVSRFLVEQFWQWRSERGMSKWRGKA
jgi:hypothetical protein